MSLSLLPCELCARTLGEPMTMTLHRECLLRMAAGGIGHLVAHEYWCVKRKDPDAGLTYRQSALLVDAWIQIVGPPE